MRELARDIESYMNTYGAELRANGLSMAHADVVAQMADGKARMDELRREFASFDAAAAQVRPGIARPRITAGRATKASSERATLRKSSNPTRARAS